MAANVEPIHTPPNVELSPTEKVLFFAEKNDAEADEVHLKLADVEAQELPNAQKRKALYHALSVWSGLVRSLNRQTYTIVPG